MGWGGGVECVVKIIVETLGVVAGSYPSCITHTSASRPRRRAAIIAAAVDKSTCLQCVGAPPLPPPPRRVR